ncbi:hypothetical protein B0T16DRAFT_31520 [Cercophora newfieldiana]|uniref:Apple domain-containing protein n=1 Tax=Cercophora newfieldiana TaxID=92897 RepID=A0AA39YPA4_9PEZI|nr:hypothetical protein B0T16DRAFT_31520 [Cercophora newfieldiana]
MDSSLQRQGSRVRFAEEEAEPGLEVVEPTKGLDDGEKRRAGGGAGAGSTAPEVYWADDNDPDGAKYTFYREGTPTPPEYEDDHVPEKAAYGHGRGSHGAMPILAAAAMARAATARASLPGNGGASPTFESGGSGGAAESQDGDPASRRKYRLTVLIIALLLIALPISIGVGLGVGLKNRALGSSGAAAGAAASSSSPSPTGANPTALPTNPDVIASPSASQTKPTNISSSSSSSSRATPTSTGAVPNLACPSANNTLYRVPGMTKTFLHICGIDYSGATGATDLSHVYTSSMAECLNVCASYDKCTGAGWGFVSGDAASSTSHRCWMKNDLRVSHTARDDYCFGILQS